ISETLATAESARLARTSAARATRLYRRTNARRSARLRSRWKRNCLRRSHRREVHRSHATAMTFSLSGTGPILLLVMLGGTGLGGGLLYYEAHKDDLAHLANDFPNDSLKSY